MRVFFATSNVPAPAHRVAGAVAIVAYEAAAAFREAGHDVVVQPIFASGRRGALTLEERNDLQALPSAGFEVEDPLWSPPRDVESFWPRLLRDAVDPSPSRFYPTYALADAVRRRVSRRGSELVFFLWSPESLAACTRLDAPTFNYQGNQDHVSWGARLLHPELFDMPVATRKQRLILDLKRLGIANWRRTHLRLMSRCRWTANNSRLDAGFYTEQGHPRSYYLQNMWWDRYGDEWEGRRERAQAEAGGGIIGNIGNLGSTGNTFGLHFLGREIVPALERLLGSRFSVTVFGPGSPSSRVAEALAQPRIAMRGWVDDIDDEILASRVFLLANNNCEDFRAGHTRVLHAWSLGACLVAHENIALAMPEVVHGTNALLGRTGEEIAQHVATVLEDPELGLLLGNAGRKTFERRFTPSAVMSRAFAIMAG